MNLFHRKPAHQLVATTGNHSNLVYQCSICTRTFSRATSATEGREYCCGKRCYVEWSFSEILAYLMTESEIKATRRTLRKHQQPLAYKHYELIGTMYGPRPVEYIPLYDVRECQCLDDSIALPAFE